MTSPSFLYLEFPLCSRLHAWMYWIAQIQLGGGKTKARHFSAEMTQKLIARDGQKAGGCLLAQACITLQITLLCVFKIYFTTMRIRGICCNENWHCVITVQIFSQIIWLAWVLACYSISSGKFLGQLDQLGITKVHPHDYSNRTPTYCFGIQCSYCIWTCSQWKFEVFSYLFL